MLKLSVLFSYYQGSSLASRTREKTLAQDTIVANARFFNNDINQVPTSALTVGVGTVMDAREVSYVIKRKHTHIHMCISASTHRYLNFIDSKK